MNMGHELAQLLEQSEVNYMVDRMTAIKERAGNPERVDIQRFGDCTAFYSQTMPWGMFNNVKGKLEIGLVDHVIDYYNSRGRSFEFQITPSTINPSVMKHLHEKGFYQSGFHTTMYCDARSSKLSSIDFASPAGLFIRELRGDEFDLYAEIHCLGTGLSLDGKSYVAANNHILYDRQGWRFYIGFDNEQPAAVAVMHMQDQVASLTFAATLPPFRGKGLQTQLLRRRIQDAYSNDCQLVVGQCAFGSPSHRNMERVGMRIGYTRATWVNVQR